MAERPRHVIRYRGCEYHMDYVFPAEIAALRAHKTGQFQELPVLEWVRELDLPGAYVDAGAHIGNHSLFFLEHCPSTVVVSIEAHPTIFELLAGNLERNSDRGNKCIAINRAAWSKSGEKVQLCKIPRNNAGHTHIVKKGGEIEVETATIDELVKGTSVAVLKIDVEDTEEQVILGAMQTLKVSRPVLIVERHSKAQLQGFEQLIKPFKYRRAKEWAGIHTYAWMPL